MNQTTPFAAALAEAKVTTTLGAEPLFYRDGRPVEPGTKVLLVKGKPVTPSRTPCCRCGGSGVWRGHFEGVCFRCGGKGYSPLDCRDQKLYTATEVAKLDASQTKRQAAKAAKQAAERDVNAEAFNTTHAALLSTIPAEWLDATGPETFWAQFNGFATTALVADVEGLGYQNDNRPKAPSAITIVRDIVLKGRRFGSINDKQVDLLTRLIVDGKAALVVLAEREAARQQQVAASAFVGTAGQKVSALVTVTKLGQFSRTSFDGRREEVVIVATFTDAQGNVLVTKTPTFGHHLTVGQTGVLSGTVKAHTTYRDVKQTQIIRPKLA